LIREVRYASAFSFKYSPRPGTPAASHEKQISEAAKTARLWELQALIQGQQAAFNAALVGRTVPVLLEKPGRRAGQVIGRSPYLQSVHLEGGLGLIGRIVDTHITGVGSNSLSGHYAHAP
jgi:tRNA-2-methylthio-N6-dimethylallyladenosine synthase